MRSSSTTSGPLVVRASTEIAAPPAEVFRHHVDPELVVKWMPTLVNASGYGELVAGATATALYRVNGREIKGSSRILDVHPPRLIVTEETIRGRPLTQRVDVTEKRGGSRVDVEVTYPPPGLATRLFFGRKAGEIGELQLARTLDRMRVLVETPGQPLPPVERLRIPARAKLVWAGLGGIAGALILWLLR